VKTTRAVTERKPRNRGSHKKAATGDFLAFAANLVVSDLFKRMLRPQRERSGVRTSESEEEPWRGKPAAGGQVESVKRRQRGTSG
jgi:hypothetical protein